MASSISHQCPEYQRCPPVVRVKDPKYLGGYYGGSSEIEMMRQIRKYGPIVSDLDVPIGFSVYKEGIFSDEHAKALYELGDKELINNLSQETGGINHRKLRDYHVEWQSINHSILIIGWGFDKKTGTKYWICRNSYGPKFGEQGGHFRVRRGSNDFGIESAPTSYMPEMLI